MDTKQFLTGKDVAKRWGVHQQTVSRRRKQGLLNWVDLSAGTRKQPTIRFRLSDIVDFEQNNLIGGDELK